MIRGSILVVLLASSLLAGCASHNPNFGELSEAARLLAVEIADDGDEISVLASESPCVIPSGCPDIARVDLSSSAVVSIAEIAEIARAQDWSTEIVDARLVRLKNRERGMSGSISRDPAGRVTIAVGED